MTANPLVKDILEGISIKVCRGSEYQGPRAGAGKAPLVLLCGSDHDQAKVLKSLEEAAAVHGPLTVALTRNAELFFPVETLRQHKSIRRVVTEADHGDMGLWLKTAGSVWCPNITQNTLVKLSQGLTESLGPCILWWALSAQLPVVLQTGACTKWTARLPQGHPMGQVVAEAIRKVEAFGAQILSDCQWGAEAATPQVSEVSAVRLIHEGNLLELAGTQKRLTVAKGQLITPAARDLAKAKGIEIR